MATTTSTANSGSPTSPGPWPELRGSPPIGSGLGEAASAAPRRRATTSRRWRRPRWRAAGARPGHETAPITASEPADDEEPETGREAGGRDQRSARLAAREDAHRLVGLERGQDERPAEARRQPRLAARHPGSGRRARWHARPTRPARRAGGPASSAASRPGRDRGVGGASRPIHGARRRARVEGRVVDGDPVQPVTDLEADALPAVLEGRPTRRRDGAGDASAGRRAVDARRPRIRPRHRSGR